MKCCVHASGFIKLICNKGKYLLIFICCLIFWYAEIETSFVSYTHYSQPGHAIHLFYW